MTKNCSERLGRLSEIVINPTPSCNLRCRYCYDRFREHRGVESKLLTQDSVFDAIIDMIDFAGSPQIRFAFIGGEALLAGLEYFERFEEIMDGVPHQPPYIQSNLTLLDDDYCEFFKKHGYRLGVSFDGIREVHDYNRGGFAETMDGIALAVDSKLLKLVTCTVTNRTAEYIEESFEMFALMKLPMRFNAGAAQIDGEYATTPENYMIAMQKLAEMWFDFGRPFRWHKMEETCRKLSTGEWVDVATPVISSCMASAINVEWDGRVNICAACARDDNYILGNIVTDHPLKILFHPNRIEFFAKTRRSRAHCRECIYRWICIGTCLANDNALMQDRDLYCAGGPGMYASVLERLGISIDEYRDMIPQEAEA